MATAALTIAPNNGLLDLLVRFVPPQERAIELYRRLLTINELAADLNTSQACRSQKFVKPMNRG